MWSSRLWSGCSPRSVPHVAPAASTYSRPSRSSRRTLVYAWLGWSVYRFRRWVLSATGLLLVLGVVWGTGVFGSLGDDGFDDPDSEASRAAHAAEGILGGGHDLLVLVRNDELTVDDPAFA